MESGLCDTLAISFLQSTLYVLLKLSAASDAIIHFVLEIISSLGLPNPPFTTPTHVPLHDLPILFYAPPSPWASQETYSFFFSLPSYFQSQPLFFVHDPQLCLHPRVIFSSTLDLGMPFQCSCCTSCESAETSTWLKAQLLILFGPKSGHLLFSELALGFHTEEA